MKPIHLEIAGLHSYREAQEIDFGGLCEAGVFGIFGPTGSGKSTILDAITLSLYGQVDRARRGTQGIINHAEESLTVSFTFELGCSPRRRFRVERKYARDRRKGDSTKSTIARVIEIQEMDERTLYEGEREVTRRVEEIVGLTVEDFTRAVVLPQGRFAEFLSLQGAERRQMLQRIFALEVYGDRLLERVRARKQQVEERLGAIEAEQRGLGDASDAAVAAAQSKLREAEAREAQTAAALKRSQNQHDTRREIWELQNELQKVAEREAELSKRRPGIAMAEAELEAANRAESVRPHLTELQEARAALAGAEDRLKTAKTDLDLASQALNRAQNAYEQARGERERREPELNKKKADLEQTQEIERKIAQLENERTGIRRMIQECEVEIAGLEQKIDELARSKEAEEQEYQRARFRLKELSIAPERRQQVTDAMLALEAFRRSQHTLQEARADYERKVLACGAARRAIQQAEEKWRQAKDRVSVWQQRLEDARRSQPDDEQLMEQTRWLDQMRACVRQIEEAERNLVKERAKRKEKEDALKLAGKEVDEAGRQLAEAKARAEIVKRRREQLAAVLERIERQNRAAYLAATLRAGEPCPVCGATEHPRPASPSDHAELETARENLRITESQMRDAETALTGAQRTEAEAQAKAQAHARLLAEACQEVKNKEEILKRSRMGLPGEQRWLPVQDLWNWVEEQDAQLRARRQALTDWKASIGGLEREVEKAREELHRAQNEKTAAEERSKAAEQQVGEAETKLEKATDDAAEKRRVLDQVRGEIPLESIEAEQRRVVELDREAERLRGLIGKQEERIGDLARTWEEKRREKEQREMDLTRLTERDRALDRQIADARAKVNAVTGGQPAARLLEAVEAELVQLKRAEEEAKVELDRATSSKGEKAQNHAAARQAWQSANDRANQAMGRLGSALREAQFPDAEQARQALRPAQRRKQLKDETESFKEEEQRLAGERRRLEQKLGDRRVTPQDWEACQKRLAEAQQAYKEAVSAKGAAEQDYNTLCRKRARWAVLEKEREHLTPLRGRLEVLQGIFKGNAFVEFVAAEQLDRIANDASVRLGQLTGYRYALEADSEWGFIIRDDWNGGVKRPAGSLSGGETFLASLALALALSTQIQLRGQHPLEFFFLDEGFGTLDPERLDVVITALERLREQRLTVGVITHVPDLRVRLPRRLIVEPAEPGGRGSRVHIEGS